MGLSILVECLLRTFSLNRLRCGRYGVQRYYHMRDLHGFLGLRQNICGLRGSETATKYSIITRYFRVVVELDLCLVPIVSNARVRDIRPQRHSAPTLENLILGHSTPTATVVPKMVACAMHMWFGGKHFRRARKPVRYANQFKRTIDKK